MITRLGTSWGGVGSGALDIEKEFHSKSLDIDNAGYPKVVDYGVALVGYQDVSLRWGYQLEDFQA